MTRQLFRNVVFCFIGSDQTLLLSGALKDQSEETTPTRREGGPEDLNEGGLGMLIVIHERWILKKHVCVFDNLVVDLLPSCYRSLFGQTISGISPRLNSPPPSPPRATPQISRLYCIASDNRIFYWFLFLVLHTHNYHSLLWLDLTKWKLSLDNCRLNLPKNDGSQTKWKRWIGDTRTGKNGIGTQWS